MQNHHMVCMLVTESELFNLSTSDTHSLIPRPPHPAFVTCSTKSGGKAWTDSSRDACHCWRHVQSVHIWVCSLPFTLLSLDSVRSFCSVCPASPIATGSIVGSYSTWRQQRHASRDKSVQAFPPLFVLQATKAGRGGLGMRLRHMWRDIVIITSDVPIQPLARTTKPSQCHVQATGIVHSSGIRWEPLY